MGKWCRCKDFLEGGADGTGSCCKKDDLFWQGTVNTSTTLIFAEWDGHSLKSECFEILKFLDSNNIPAYNCALEVRMTYFFWRRLNTWCGFVIK
jgi:hypothetical protein